MRGQQAQTRPSSKWHLTLLLLLTGCAPYVGYRHDSNPHIENDGLDLICVGNEFRYVIEVKTGICHVAGNGDNVIEFQVDYFPLDER